MFFGFSLTTYWHWTLPVIVVTECLVNQPKCDHLPAAGKHQGAPEQRPSSYG